MENFLKSIDFVSQIPIFFYDKNIRFKTILGGLIQIVITVIWISGIIFFSKDIYLRENPSVITSTEYDRIPYERNYTNGEDVFFMISLNDPVTWAPFIDETYYTVKFTTTSKIKQQKGPIENLKTVICTNKMLEGKEDYTVGIPIQNYYCLDPDIKNVTFKGTQTSPDSKYIKIGVHMCMNTTENNNFCKTPEKITEKLAGSSFNLFFFNSKFEPKNFEKPNDNFLDFHHSFYSNLYYKLIFVTLKQVQYIDDTGFLFESLNSKDYYALNDIKEVFHFQKQADAKFLDIAVNFGTNKENIRRNYKRIQSVIAEVGGLFKAIFIFVMLIRILVMDEYIYKYLNYFLSSKKISQDNLHYDKSNLNLINKLQMTEFNTNNNLNILNTKNNKNNFAKDDDKQQIENTNKFSVNLKKKFEFSENKLKDENILDLVIQNNLKKTERNQKLIKIQNSKLQVLTGNYFNQKEIMKLITDFTLIRYFIFDFEQNTKFEEMSRNIDIITDLMYERETIIGIILDKNHCQKESNKNIIPNIQTLNLKKYEQ